MEAGKIITYNLKRLRGGRDLTLGQLFNLADVNKVVLSWIEKGKANPTINTIWRIAETLQLLYSALLETQERATAQIRKKEISTPSEGKYHIFRHYAKTTDRSFELCRMETEPGCEHTSGGHSTNSFEYLMVLKGELIPEIRGEGYFLKKDDVIRPDGSVSYFYKNAGKKDARTVMSTHYR